MAPQRLEIETIESGPENLEGLGKAAWTGTRKDFRPAVPQVALSLTLVL
jgi:hypothetical protein